MIGLTPSEAISWVIFTRGVILIAAMQSHPSMLRHQAVIILIYFLYINLPHIDIESAILGYINTVSKLMKMQ